MSKPRPERPNPTWYKDAVIYEVHVRSFSDSGQDGHGDFRGLAEKLDYLQDLGVNTLWLLPFYPSPLRDDGYDIANYCDIHKDFGTLSDFRSFLREAHSRGIRIITELVLNHTSDQHDWFQRARRAKPGSSARNFYVWSDSPEKYASARIIFKDFEHSNWTWDPVAGAYYWHRFYAHQPDLNFDNPQVKSEILRIVDFWLGMGVDGLRLDAVPYLYEREGSNCENLPETYAFLRKLRAHVDAKYPDRTLLAEANQWPEDAARYFGDGDACHMTFHFPLMPRMFVALEMEDRAPIVDILEQTPDIPPDCQWALFLRNHDELTLEMVSEEERDFMYQVYARDRQARINLGIRRRLAPLLGNDRRKIELMNVLLLTMPGSPVLYYGDEIGMGDNYYLGDRNGVRTPMQWSPDRNAGFSRANPQRLYLPVVIDPEYHYESVNVENQQRNPSSLLWWMKQLIAMRKRYQALGRGNMRFVSQDSPKVLAFVRTLGEDSLLVVANLSRHPQSTRLNLAAHAGSIPVEVFGRTPFPTVTDQPYPLSLGPHGYYIMELHTPHRTRETRPVRMALRRQYPGGWSFLDAHVTAELQGVILPEYLRRRTEAQERRPQIISTILLDSLPVGTSRTPASICLLELRLAGGGGEYRTQILSFVDFERARQVAKEQPERYVCDLEGPLTAAATGQAPQEGALVEGPEERSAHAGLLRLFVQSRRVRGRSGEFSVHHSKQGRELRDILAGEPDSELLKGGQGNALIAYGRQVLLKIFRQTAEGGNPDLEVVQHLTERAGFRRTPEVLASLRYARAGHDPVILAVLRRFVPSESTAWDMCTTALGLFFSRVLAEQRDMQPDDGWAAVDEGLGGTALDEPIGTAMALIGRITAEMHAALAADFGDPAFTPEPFDKIYRRAVFQDIFSKTRRILDQLEEALPALPPEEASWAELALALRDRLNAKLRRFRDTTVEGLKIRVHGEYDLRHLLCLGRDFMVVDFEGRTTRSLSARRLKRSPLRDICDLLNSLALMADAALRNPSLVRDEDAGRLRPWADFWQRRMSERFLESYLATAGQARFLPQGRANLDLVLTTLLLDQAFFELGQTLAARRAAEETRRRGASLSGILRSIHRILSDNPGEEESI